mmetsp:Transcript_47540/g.146406  ORF Transcript_47540/g.146406 Transcript_47540/m.146406 type:complete len:481 (+) Transcript_47540:75-1517(+)
MGSRGRVLGVGCHANNGTKHGTRRTFTLPPLAPSQAVHQLEHVVARSASEEHHLARELARVELRLQAAVAQQANVRVQAQHGAQLGGRVRPDAAEGGAEGPVQRARARVVERRREVLSLPARREGRVGRRVRDGAEHHPVGHRGAKLQRPEQGRHEELRGVERRGRAPVARGCHLAPQLPPVDRDKHRHLRDELQLLQQVVHRPERHREVGEGVPLAADARQQHVGQRGLAPRREVRVRLSPLLALDGDALELPALRKVDRLQQQRRGVGRLVQVRACQLGRHRLEVVAVPHPVRLVGLLRRARSHAHRPVGCPRREHHQPARSLARRSRIVERPRLAVPPLADQHEAGRVAQAVLRVGGARGAPEQLVAQLEDFGPHQRRRRLGRLLLPSLAAQAGVEEEAGKGGAALEREDLPGVGGRVRERLVARSHEPAQVRLHPTLRRLQRPILELTLRQQNTALLLQRRLPLEVLRRGDVRHAR